MTRVSITFSRHDKLLIAWRDKAATCGHGTISFLVRKALVAFIEDNEFINIGKIHYNPDAIPYIPNDNFVLSIASNSIIQQWIQANVDNGLGKSEPIKYILRNCIEIIPDSEEEFIPVGTAPTMEKTMLDIMRANARIAINTAGSTTEYNTSPNSINKDKPKKDNVKPIPYSENTDPKETKTPEFDMVKVWNLGPKR